jgi:hypothetical protein
MLDGYGTICECVESVVTFEIVTADVVRKLQLGKEGDGDDRSTEASNYHHRRH